MLNYYNYTLGSPVTPIMWGIVSLHDHIMIFLTCILFVVLFMFNRILFAFDFREMWKMIRRFYNPRNEDCFRLSGEFIKERVCEKSYKVHKYVSGKSLRHGMLIEIIWTIIPSLILY